ncbi:MAG TPA: DNA cytosine methyltransferase [Actinomycetes bacterium]|jgi:DNA (cytosine-5)-methyltransferase 1|nr:DNA cytosine methyltransferase [Actinomycetes bacterium]
MTTNTSRSTTALVSIDLFCGAGGLTLGLSLAGFSSVLGLDEWEPAVATFEHNFPTVPAVAADARDYSGQDILSKAGLDGAPDIIVGGPPCQGFSSAGARKAEDDRNTLVRTFAELVAELLPRAFLFENVEGFLTARSGSFVIDLLDPLVEAGYRIRLRKVNVANYGIPQLRKRVIGIGLLHADPDFPAPTHRAHGAPGAHRVAQWSSLPMTPTVGETLGNLPAPADGPPGEPPDHFMVKLDQDDLARVRALRQGQTMRDLPAELHHPSYQRRAYRRVMDGTPTERRGGPPAGLRRLRADEPSKAITGAAVREFLHPTQDRPLTLRECARLQTFPDDFEFSGNRAERATLIGNAVPPLFAAALGATLARALHTAGEAPQGRGRLLSFETTVADAKSPALAAVEELVTRRYGIGELTLWP